MSDETSQFKLFGLPGGPAIGNAERRAILEQNQLFREGRMHKLRDVEFGHVTLNIPPLDFEILKRRFPDLNSRDGGVRHRAWQKFIRSPFSMKYKLDRYEGFATGTSRMGAGSRIVVPTSYTRRID